MGYPLFVETGYNNFSSIVSSREIFFAFIFFSITHNFRGTGGKNGQAATKQRFHNAVLSKTENCGMDSITSFCTATMSSTLQQAVPPLKNTLNNTDC